MAALSVAAAPVRRPVLRAALSRCAGECAEQLHGAARERAGGLGDEEPHVRVCRRGPAGRQHFPLCEGAQRVEESSGKVKR